MMFKKSTQTILLGIILGIYMWLGMWQNPLLAAMPNELVSDISAEPPGFPKLELAVDRYLLALPAGYYAIGNVADLKSLMAKSQALVIDVRSPSEYRSGHIPGATNIPLPQLARSLSKIPTDRPVVLYCATGYRSAMGVMTLQLFNYDNVRGFPPSLAAWQAAGEEIVK
jgi:rhodanese-related sulfurtransferase